MPKLKHFTVEEKITLSGMTWTVTLSTDSNTVAITPNAFLDELDHEDITIFFNKVEAAMKKLRRKAGRRVSFINFPLTANDFEAEVHALADEEREIQMRQQNAELTEKHRRNIAAQMKADKEMIAFLTDLIECES